MNRNGDRELGAFLFLFVFGVSTPILADDDEVRIGRYQTVRSAPEAERASCVNGSAKATQNRATVTEDPETSAEDAGTRSRADDREGE